ncbi:MAG: putative lipopolysaccharide heptosyltransferase III [Verrucomicrobia bacterium]|nr:putative lipopolysaccharide heptosyltransferase III [Verrucomicrobiota bacterium]MDE3047677.1 putative lipopolysaccharide heptosyltransferase III [Verrucomicrobiota bacterium]
MTYGDYPALNNIKKILVVKLRQLGDVLLTGPVFKGLKHRFPNANIDAYIYKEAFPMLEGHPDIHQLIGYDRKWKQLSLWKRLRQEWALWKQIRQARYDLVINLTEGDRGALAAKISRAPVRVGFEPKGKWQKDLYTHVVKHCPTLRHTVEKNLDALRRIGIFPPLEQRELFLSLTQEAKTRVEGSVNSPFVLIHPTSRWRFKCWPAEKMRALTEILLRKGKQVVFTAGPDAAEQEMVAQITEGLDVLNLSGKISLQDLAAWIDRSELLVCVDSVPFHMANALKKRVVALFGPTSDVTWGPWRNPDARIVAQNISCRPCYMDGCGGSKMSDCLATLDVRSVIRAIDDLEITGGVPYSLKSSPR